MRYHFCQVQDEDDRGINDSRALACEVVAWRFVTHLTYQESIDYLCCELPLPKPHGGCANDNEDCGLDESALSAAAEERTPLLDASDESFGEGVQYHSGSALMIQVGTFATIFAGLNALEIAAVSGSRKFLSQRPIQRIIDGIWKGDIVF